MFARCSEADLASLAKHLHSRHVEYIHDSKLRTAEIVLSRKNLVKDVKLGVKLCNPGLGSNLIREMPMAL